MNVVGLDAVRALAIILVMICHYVMMFHPEIDPSFWSFLGALGVQMFFSLSGFLIGRILIGLTNQPNLSTWLKFMARRWLRTLPLYWVVLSVLVLLSGSESDMHRDYVELFTLTQNLISNPPVTFGVSWSLAVEEIFYLAFATISFVAVRLAGYRAIWLVVGIFIIGPTSARLWLEFAGYHYPEKSALLCLDAIGWGILLALLEKSRINIAKFSRLLLPLSVTLICLSYVGYWHSINFTAMAIGCTLLVEYARHKADIKLFKQPSTVIARYSYGIYLVHVPTMLICSSIGNEFFRIFVYMTMLAIFVYGFNILVEVPFMKVRPSQT
jgi:peptidoglycan/LPS O-acetylase OafA/YrhL